MRPLNRSLWIRCLIAASLASLAGPGLAEEPSSKDMAASDASKEPVDVLRKRLAERLANKSEGAMKVAGKGGDEKKVPKRGEAKPREIHWGYAGDGAPDRWAEISADNKLCAVGTRQSPIDIRDGIRVDLEKIAFDYRPSSFSVLDNGHTIQVNVGSGNILGVMGRRFELVQFHFHKPSEERINGRQFDMVAHLVHKDADGKLAVVAVLLERGKDQPVVQTIWANIPLEKGEALPAPGLIDLNHLLPEERGYYTYMGSLTTPPCSEGVLWMVMRQPVPISANQLAIFGKLYPMNARPIQAGSGRLIKESSSGP